MVSVWGKNTEKRWKREGGGGSKFRPTFLGWRERPEGSSREVEGGR